MRLVSLKVPLARPSITDSEIEAVSEILRSGHLTTGPKVQEFEFEFSKYIGAKNFAVALNSCTGGLYLSLLACGIGEGDEVIVPTWTFAATAHVVFWTGAKPVLCDVEPETLNLSVERAEALVTPRTRVILPVHFAGYPCRMNEILNLAGKHRLIVIEDAAHAAGTRYQDKKIGDFGDATVFSFYATKNLTCGEGGMVVSREQGLVEKVRKLSYFGINKSPLSAQKRDGWYYEIEELGYKYNMDSIHAAIGMMQLKRLDEMNERRRQIARMYRENLDRRIRFPEDREENYHTYHLFPVRIPQALMDRERFMSELKERNIGTSVHYIPLHRHPFYKGVAGGRAFPVADEAYREIVSIPMFPDMSEDEVFYVIECVNEILKRSVR